MRGKLRLKLARAMNGLSDLCDGQDACDQKAEALARVLYKALVKRNMLPGRWVRKVYVRYLCALRKGGTLEEADYDNSNVCRRSDQGWGSGTGRQAMALMTCDKDCQLVSVYDAETTWQEQEFDIVVGDSVTDPEVQGVWGPGEGVDGPLGPVGEEGESPWQEHTHLPVSTSVPAPVHIPTPSPNDDKSRRTVPLVLGVMGGLMCLLAAVVAVIINKKSTANAPQFDQVDQYSPMNVMADDALTL